MPDDAGVVRPCWQLLVGMMEQAAWRELLFADISAIILFRRLHVLVEVLARPQARRQAAPSHAPCA